MEGAMSEGRYFCERCSGRYAAGGDCPKCKDEPLLDLVDDEVRIMLESMDDRAKMKRYSMLLVLVIVLTMPLSLGLIFFWLGWLIGIPAAAFMVGGLTAGLVKVFPAPTKAPQVSQAELEQFQYTH